MELSFETDAEALWQDTLDILSSRDLPEAVLAMLRNCEPVGMEGGSLRLQTSMRLVHKTVAKNAELIEEALSQAAFEPMRLEVSFSPTTTSQATPVARSSSMTREEADRWASETGQAQARETTPRPIIEDTWDESAVREREAENRRRRERNPLVEDISDATSKLTFERFVRGEENDIAYQAALQVANGMNSTYNPLFI